MHKLVHAVAVRRLVVVVLAAHHLLVKLPQSFGGGRDRRARAVLLGETQNLSKQTLAHGFHHRVVRHLFAHALRDAGGGDGALGGAEVPPPVVLHALRRAQQRRAARREVRLLKVQGNEQPPGADPRECDALGAKVVLEHPVVPPGLVEDDGPYSGEVVHGDGKVRLLQLDVRAFDPGVELGTDAIVRLARARARRPLEKRVHRAHRERKRRERADDVGDAQRVLGVEAAHQLLLAAHHAHGHASAERLAVHHHVGVDAVVLLRAAGRHAEPGVHLVEHEGHVALRAKRAQRLEPNRVVVHRFVRRGFADRGGHQHQVVRRRRVGVETLQRVDDDAGDLASARLDGGERRGGHVLERQHVGDFPLVPGAGLHAVPPAVVRAREAHHQLAALVERREPHRAHDRLRAGHVERNLVQLGDGFDHREVLAHDWVQRAEHRPEVFRRLPALLHPALVVVVAAHVHAVRPGDVQRLVAVQVHDAGALGRGGQRSDVEPLAHQLLKRKRHAVGVREPQIADTVQERLRGSQRLRKLLLERLRERVETEAAFLRDLSGGAVGGEETRFVVRERTQDPRREARAVGSGGRGLFYLFLSSCGACVVRMRITVGCVSRQKRRTKQERERERERGAKKRRRSVVFRVGRFPENPD